MIRTLVNVSEANPELLKELESLESTRDRAERLRVLATIGLMVVKGNANLSPTQQGQTLIPVSQPPAAIDDSNEGSNITSVANNLLKGII